MPYEDRPVRDPTENPHNGLTKQLRENLGEKDQIRKDVLEANYEEVISAFRASDDYTLDKEYIAEEGFNGRKRAASATLNVMEDIGAISLHMGETYLNGYMDSEDEWKLIPDYYWEMLEASLREVVSEPNSY